MQLLHNLLSVSAVAITLYFSGRFGVLQAQSNFNSVAMHLKGMKLLFFKDDFGLHLMCSKLLPIILLDFPELSPIILLFFLCLAY